jgi:hypothetical protein
LWRWRRWWRWRLLISAFLCSFPCNVRDSKDNATHKKKRKDNNSSLILNF